MLFTSCNNDLTVDKDDCLRETGHEHCENIP